MLAELWLFLVVTGFWWAVCSSLARYNAAELEAAASIPLQDDPDESTLSGKEF